jgi:replicative DNA helicase
MNVQELMRGLEKEIREQKNTIDQESALLRLQDIAETYSGDDRVVSSEELFEEIQRMPVKPKFKSGFTALDNTMQGFVTGEMIFVSGITKHGKTSMCMELSHRFKEQNPLWLSFEEKAIDLLRKFNERTGEFPQIFTPRKNELTNLEWIEKKIVESKAKYDSKVVFIDHLGFIGDAERNRDESEASRYERISREIHSLAVKWDVLIFLLGHLTKVGITQNIKGSSAMAQEADLTMLIWRKTSREGGKIVIGNETNLSLQANRRGETGNIEFVYENGRFNESVWHSDEQEETWQS